MKNEKTSLGISVSLMSAAIYFSVFFGGLIPALLIAGYVFLKENSDWLKRVSVKAIILYICFAVLSEFTVLIPDGIRVVSNFAGIFGASFSIPFISGIMTFLSSAVSFMKAIVFLLLGFQALKQLDFPLSFVDKMIDSGVEAADKAVASVKKDEPKTEPSAEAEKTEEN